MEIETFTRGNRNIHTWKKKHSHMETEKYRTSFISETIKPKDKNLLGKLFTHKYTRVASS